MNRIVLTLGVALLVCVSPSAGQEWGSVPKDILDMTAIPEDPEADAVVLFDKATVAITLRFQLVQHRHVRIKILTQRGLSYANISIPFRRKDKVKNLKAHTILPDGKRIELKKKDLFEKKKGKNLKEKVFAIPGAQPGAVVEYIYEISGQQLAFLAPWQFQGAEFSRLSELTVIIPEGFDYRAFCANFRGNVGVPQPTREIFQIADPQMGQCLVGKFTWRVENLPGIKPEPYMTSLKDYLATIYFQVASYQNPRDPFAKPVVLLKTWDDLAKAVNTDYKPFLQATRKLKALASDLVSGAADERTKIRSVYSYVRGTIETASSNGAAPKKRPDDMVKDRKGTAIEKNLLFINLLRCAGIHAYPLLISTRNHGRFQDQWAQLQQFNHVIAYLPPSEGGSPCFLDAKNKYCPFAVLPPNDLSEKGFLVEDDSCRIVGIPAPANVNIRRANTHATLSGNGELICRTVLAFEGYPGVSKRMALGRQKREKYVKEILESRFGEVTLDSFSIGHEDSIEAPLEIVMDYRVLRYAQVAGDMIYLKPVLMHRLESNPFKREKRSFPVEFNYATVSTEEVVLEIPEGYRVLEPPREVRIPFGDLQFTSTCQGDTTRKVTFQRHLASSKLVYETHEYTGLRNTYARIVNADQGQLVLTRRQESAVTDE